MTSARFILLLVCAMAVTQPRADETFPLPDELRPDVDFWVSIFTDYDSSEGVLHDNRDLGVVYERIALTPGMSRRERQRVVSKRRDALKQILRDLASGKRDDLGAEEARVLALWPDDVSNETLAAAVGQIRFQQGLSDRFEAGLERAGIWRPFIESEFNRLGVPVDLAALPHVESSYNPEARSHVGASGIWQFTRSTARRYMRVDHVIDERNDPFAATTGAGRLLAFNYSITGNWPMAITAYNHGLSGVRRAMRNHGDTAYVDIFRNYKGRTFGFASRNFYVAFLAAREVDLNTDRYFPGLRPKPPADDVLLRLPDYVSAADLADSLGLSQRDLARYNPALQPTVWQGSKHIPRDFPIRLPRAYAPDGADALLAAVAPGSWQQEQLPDLFHTIRRGDTLSEIAETYDTRVSTLVALNGLSSSNRIRAGQQLRLPAAGPPPMPEEPAEVLTAAAEAEVSADEPAGSGPAPEPVAEVEPAAMVGEFASTLMATLQTSLLSDPSDYSVGDDMTVEVQPLETLGHLADWLGIRTQRLRDINGLAFRTPVEVGQRIRLEFDEIDIDRFESRRISYHRNQQDNFFRRHTITGITEHVVARGESIWLLALREYDVPIWLFRQYNPGLDMARIRAGTTVRFPQMATIDPS